MNRHDSVVGQPSRLSVRASRPRGIVGRDAPTAGATPAPLRARTWRVIQACLFSFCLPAPLSNGHLPSMPRDFVLCCATCLWFTVAVSAKSLTLYVAPDGNDRWSGRLAQPAHDGADGPFST